jgi:two-component SAPR family response regulator
MSKSNLVGLKVLIIEDEPLISMFIEDSLADIGCTTVGTITRLSGAASKIDEVECDVIMLDVNLSGEQTIELAELLLKRRLPFIFSTGYGHSGIPPHLHHVPVLQKPFQEGDLRDALLLVLDGGQT